MTEEEKQLFIRHTKEIVKQNPDLLNRIIISCNQGMIESINEANDRARDMETIAVAFQSTMNERYKKSTDEWMKNLVKSKLSNWKGKTSFEWSND